MSSVSRKAALRGVGLVGVCVLIVDWGVKLAHPWIHGWWIPHQTQRPVWSTLFLVTILCLLLAAIFCRPLATLGSGLMIGGSWANLLDLAHNGVVWDMIPLPGSDIVFNLADVAVFTGGLMLVAAAGWMLAEAFVPNGIEGLYSKKIRL